MPVSYRDPPAYNLLAAARTGNEGRAGGTGNMGDPAATHLHVHPRLIRGRRRARRRTTDRRRHRQQYHHTGKPHDLPPHKITGETEKQKSFLGYCI